MTHIVQGQWEEMGHGGDCWEHHEDYEKVNKKKKERERDLEISPPPPPGLWVSHMPLG